MLTEFKNVVLLHGVLQADAFDQLKESGAENIVVLEGRPDLAAVRNASANLQQRGLVTTVMADNMAGYLFSKGLVKEVWLAAQSQDKSGSICAIGALILAVLAKKHGVSVRTLPSGRKTRGLGKPADLKTFNGQSVVTGKIKAFVPLLEWVPAKYLGRNHE